MFECFDSQKLLAFKPPQLAMQGLVNLVRVLPLENRWALLEYARPRALLALEQTSLDDIVSMQVFGVVCSSFDGENKQVLQAEYDVKQKYLRALRLRYAENDYRVLNTRLEILLLAEKLNGYIDLKECEAIYRQLLRSGGRANLLRLVGSKLLSYTPGDRNFPFLLLFVRGGRKDVEQLMREWGRVNVLKAFRESEALWDTDSGRECFRKDEQAARAIVSELWEKTDELMWRVDILSYYCGHVLTVYENCGGMKPEILSKPLDWVAEKIRVIAGELSQRSSPEDVRRVVNVCCRWRSLLLKLPASDDRRARIGDYLDVFRLLEKNAPRSMRCEIHVGRLLEEGQISAFSGDLRRGNDLCCAGLKLACRKGVFMFGFVRNIRELLLDMLLHCAKEIAARDASGSPLAWAEPLLRERLSGWRARRCAKKLFEDAVGSCIERLRAQTTDLSKEIEDEMRKQLARFSLTLFKKLAAHAIHEGGTPFEMSPKKYWRCRSVRKYVLAFLEYACRKLAEVELNVV